TSLATTPEGDIVVALSQRGQGRGCLSVFSRSVGYRMQQYHLVKTDGHAWLCPQIPRAADLQVALWAENRFKIHRLPDLLPIFTSDLLGSVSIDGHNYTNGEPAVAGIYWLPSDLIHFGLAAFSHRVVWY